MSSSPRQEVYIVSNRKDLLSHVEGMEDYFVCYNQKRTHEAFSYQVSAEVWVHNPILRHDDRGSLGKTELQGVGPALNITT